MRVDVEFPNFTGIMAEIEGDIAKAATEAMRGTSYKALRELREQVTSNGLGQRLANTWRDRVYPEKRRSMTPTGYIWSNAPEIVDSFLRGATIRPASGGNYLWIPTDNVPRARGRVSVKGKNIKGGKMAPQEVEAMFNTSFFFRRGRNGTLLAFIDATRGKRAGTIRQNTAGRRKQNRMAEPILMYVLRRAVRLPKLLDLKGPSDKWAANFVDEFTRRLAG